MNVTDSQQMDLQRHISDHNVVTFGKKRLRKMTAIVKNEVAHKYGSSYLNPGECLSLFWSGPFSVFAQNGSSICTDMMPVLSINPVLQAYVSATLSSSTESATGQNIMCAEL